MRLSAARLPATGRPHDQTSERRISFARERTRSTSSDRALASVFASILMPSAEARLRSRAIRATCSAAFSCASSEALAVMLAMMPSNPDAMSAMWSTPRSLWKGGGPRRVRESARRPQKVRRMPSRPLHRPSSAAYKIRPTTGHYSTELQIPFITVTSALRTRRTGRPIRPHLLVTGLACGHVNVSGSVC